MLQVQCFLGSRAKLHKDGLNLETSYLHVQAKPAPLLPVVVWIHGGPGSAHRVSGLGYRV